jgi:hypothetical protein
MATSDTWIRHRAQKPHNQLQYESSKLRGLQPMTRGCHVTVTTLDRAYQRIVQVAYVTKRWDSIPQTKPNCCWVIRSLVETRMPLEGEAAFRDCEGRWRTCGALAMIRSWTWVFKDVSTAVHVWKMVVEYVPSTDRTRKPFTCRRMLSPRCYRTASSIV